LLETPSVWLIRPAKDSRQRLLFRFFFLLLFLLLLRYVLGIAWTGKCNRPAVWRPARRANAFRQIGESPGVTTVIDSMASCGGSGLPSFSVALIKTRNFPSGDHAG
jgi:hypothetical protein